MIAYNNSYLIEFKDTTKVLVNAEEVFFPAGLLEYVTREGDTLFSIAGRFLDSTARWVDIAETNDLVDLIEIPIGTTLNIPTNV